MRRKIHSLIQLQRVILQEKEWAQTVEIFKKDPKSQTDKQTWKPKN